MSSALFAGTRIDTICCSVTRTDGLLEDDMAAAWCPPLPGACSSGMNGMLDEINRYGCIFRNETAVVQTTHNCTSARVFGFGATLLNWLQRRRRRRWRRASIATRNDGGGATLKPVHRFGVAVGGWVDDVACLPIGNRAPGLDEQMWDARGSGPAAVRVDARSAVSFTRAKWFITCTR